MITSFAGFQAKWANISLPRLSVVNFSLLTNADFQSSEASQQSLKAREQHG
jgi:hypothetical protein